MNGHIAKPLDMNKLSDVLKNGCNDTANGVNRNAVIYLCVGEKIIDRKTQSL